MQKAQLEHRIKQLQQAAIQLQQTPHRVAPTFIKVRGGDQRGEEHEPERVEAHKKGRWALNVLLVFIFGEIGFVLFTVAVWIMLFDKLPPGGDENAPDPMIPGIDFGLEITKFDRDDRKFSYTTIPQFWMIFTVVWYFIMHRIGSETWARWNNQIGVTSAMWYAVVQVILEFIFLLGLIANLISSSIFMFPQCKDGETCNAFPSDRVGRAAFVTSIVGILVVLGSFISSVVMWWYLRTISSLYTKWGVEGPEGIKGPGERASGKYGRDPHREQMSHDIASNNLPYNSNPVPAIHLGAQGNMPNRRHNPAPGPPQPHPDSGTFDHNGVTLSMDLIG